MGKNWHGKVVYKNFLNRVFFCVKVECTYIYTDFLRCEFFHLKVSIFKFCIFKNYVPFIKLNKLKRCK